MLKKEFKDKDFDGKVTTKATAGDGTTFEANFSDKNNGKEGQPPVYNDADFTVTLPIDDSFKLKTTAKANRDVSLNVDVKVDANCSCNFTLENPDISDKIPGDVLFGGTYATPDFSVELEGQLCKGGDFKAMGAAVGLAAPVPGVDGLCLGLKPTLTTIEAGETEGSVRTNLSANLAYEQKDYHVGVNSFFTNTAAAVDKKPKVGDFKFGGAEATIWAKVRDDLQLAAKYTVNSEATAGRPAWGPAKLLPALESSFAIGTQYSLSKSQTAKTKVTLSKSFEKITCDFALKTALEGKSNLVLSMQLDGAKPKFGMVYNLE